LDSDALAREASFVKRESQDRMRNPVGSLLDLAPRGLAVSESCSRLVRARRDVIAFSRLQA
jgi:hypothetical protein